MKEPPENMQVILTFMQQLPAPMDPNDCEKKIREDYSCNKGIPLHYFIARQPSKTNFNCNSLIGGLLGEIQKGTANSGHQLT